MTVVDADLAALDPDLQCDDLGSIARSPARRVASPSTSGASTTTCAGPSRPSCAAPVVAAPRGRARPARDRPRAAGAQPSGRRVRIGRAGRGRVPGDRPAAARHRLSPAVGPVGPAAPGASGRCPATRPTSAACCGPASWWACPSGVSCCTRSTWGRFPLAPIAAALAAGAPIIPVAVLGLEVGRWWTVRFGRPIATRRRRDDRRAGRAGRGDPHRAPAPASPTRRATPDLQHAADLTGRQVPERWAGPPLRWAAMAFADAADGTRLHYEVFGARHGEPLLLIQGLGADSRGWLRQRRALSGRFRCIVFDNRGAGPLGPPARALRPRGHGRRRPRRARRGRRGPGPRDGGVDGRHPRPDHRRAPPRAGAVAGAGLHRVSPPRVAPRAARRSGPTVAERRRHGLVRPPRRPLADRSPLAAALLAGGRAGRPAWP